MTSRERVRKAIRHEEPDRPPLDLGATPVTGIHASTLTHLRAALELEKRPVRMWEPFQCLGEVELDLISKLGVDVLGIHAPTTFFGYRNDHWRPWQLPDGTEVLVGAGFLTKTADDGTTLIYPQGDETAPPSGRMPKDGFYFDAITRQEPIDADSLDPEAFAQDQFSVLSDSDLDALSRQAERYYRETDLALVGGFWQGGFGDIALVPGVSIKQPKGIRDPEQWMLAHLLYPEYIRGIYEIQCEIALRNLELYRQAVGNRIEVIVMSGTDFGAQRGLLISLDMYRDLYKPFHVRLNRWVHENTAWKTFYHSCGDIGLLIDDLVDSGVDILNPVQCSCPSMGPEALKEKYGDRVVFWGGGVDTQKTLPFGQPEDVRDEVRKRMRIFSKGGGFVFSTIHNVQAKTPIENLRAAYEQARCASSG